MIELTKKKIMIGFFLAIFIITPISLILMLFQSPNQGTDMTIVSGTLTSDTTWEGFIRVEGNVNVPENVTLTILPGTFIEFKHHRDYKTGNRIGLSTNGGDIVAIGTPDQQIWFTSDAEDPINADWGGITCSKSNATVFKYVIVEFGFIGIEAANSRINVTHSIIRWIHAEGIYSSQSRFLIESCLLYDNGYHDLALENFNPNITIQYCIFNGGNYGIGAEATNARIIGNYFVNYSGTAISGNQYSNMTIIENRFENVGDQIILGPTTTNVTLDNDLLGNGTVPIPVLDFDNPEPRKLGYVPGDPEDRYLYVYPELDETREVLRKLENETTFDWTLEYVNGCLWKFEHRSFMAGSLQDFVKINLTTEEKEIYGNNMIINPNGLAYDGEYFWTHDIVLKKIFKFKPNSSNLIEITGTYNIPAEISAVFGLGTDGTNLFFSGGDGGKYLYKLDKDVNVLETINLVGGTAIGGITWTGSHFWCAEEQILTKWHLNGSIAGKIYPVAEGTIGITWDGSNLWTSQKTCESWLDAKIFQIEIIDDQIIVSQ